MAPVQAGVRLMGDGTWPVGGGPGCQLSPSQKRVKNFLKGSLSSWEVRTIKALVKHINPFFKNSQSIKIPGGISHRANKPQSFRFAKPQVHGGRPLSPAGRAGREQTPGPAPPEAGSPPLPSAAPTQPEPAFPDLSMFQQKQGVWTYV